VRKLVHCGSVAARGARATIQDSSCRRALYRNRGCEVVQEGAPRRTARGKLSRHNEVAKAMDYMLKRIEVFTRFLDDGRICLSNNAAERGGAAIASARLISSVALAVCELCICKSQRQVSDLPGGM
jgi:hypothetical protein